jgi:hypothetical protein
MSTWILVDPVATRKVTDADRIVTKTTPIKRIGFLENHKANASELQIETGKRLRPPVPLEQHFYGKPTASLAAPQDLISKISEEVDVVLVGSAD